MPTVFAIFFEDADVPNVVGVPVVATTFAVVPAGLPVFVYIAVFLLAPLLLLASF
jgi:hypothetical protein